jgi:hypothetical protein
MKMVHELRHTVLQGTVHPAETALTGGFHTEVFPAADGEGKAEPL